MNPQAVNCQPMTCVTSHQHHDKTMATLRQTKTQYIFHEITVIDFNTQVYIYTCILQFHRAFRIKVLRVTTLQTTLKIR